MIRFKRTRKTMQLSVTMDVALLLMLLLYLKY